MVVVDNLSLVGVRKNRVRSIELRLSEVVVRRIAIRRGRHLRKVVGLLIKSLSGPLLLSVKRTVELRRMRKHDE